MSRRNQSKEVKRSKVKMRIRSKVSGSALRPRLSVFKSNKAVYCQLIDDEAGVTLASSQSLNGPLATGTKIERADKVGQEIASKALAIKVNTVVFDRSGYPYHGIVKSLAEGARKGGLNF
jgi:large subunit ribosomal protein L18